MPKDSLLPLRVTLKPRTRGGSVAWGWVVVGFCVLSIQGNVSLVPESLRLSSPRNPPRFCGLTLVTDDKASFPAKPINKLNRQKMSI